MSGPSNIKIQKTGAEEVGNAQVRSPASDLERSKDPSPRLRLSHEIRDWSFPEQFALDLPPQDSQSLAQEPEPELPPRRSRSGNIGVMRGHGSRRMHPRRRKPRALVMMGEEARSSHGLHPPRRSFALATDWAFAPGVGAAGSGVGILRQVA